jgi:TolB protein
MRPDFPQKIVRDSPDPSKGFSKGKLISGSFMKRFQHPLKIKILYGSILVLVVVIAGLSWIWKGRVKPLVVLCAGDSFTASGYPDTLRNLFEKKKIKARVVNKGVNGHTSGEYLHFMKQNDILNKENPDVVLLMLGTNDIRVDRDHTRTDQFIKNMNEILFLIKAYSDRNGKKPKIFLSNIPPIPENPPSTFSSESIIRVTGEINPAIESIAREQEITLVDNYQLFIDRKDLLHDIHPTQKGYELMAENWYRHVAENRSAVKKSVHEIEKSQPPADGLSGKITFQSDRDGDEEVYIMNPKGEEILQLTSNTSFDGYPVWSADGTKIAFESNRDGSFQIYAMNQDGTHQIKISRGPFENRYPSWSPDGKTILYQSKRKNGDQIYAMDLENKMERPITDSWYKSGLPSWSPDGKSIAFTANKFFGWGVYIMEKDGSDVRPLDTEGGSCRPRWKRDSSLMAYVSQKGDNKGDIWIMNRNGKEKKRLTMDSQTYDYFPSWNSNGKWIVYSSTNDKEKGNWEIRVINVESGESKQITAHPAQDVYPDWH